MDPRPIVINAPIWLQLKLGFDGLGYSEEVFLEVAVKILKRLGQINESFKFLFALFFVLLDNHNKDGAAAGLARVLLGLRPQLL